MQIHLGSDTVKRALTFANLTLSNLKKDAHPDDGTECLYLEADIRQYSAFLVALAVQYRRADGLLPLADRVRLQHTQSGDTRFWMPGVHVRGI